MYSVYYQQGLEALKAFQYSVAKHFFIQAACEQTTPECYLQLGKAYFFCDEYDKAISALISYADYNQQHPGNVMYAHDSLTLAYAYDLLGQCYQKLACHEHAIICYEQATQYEPNLASAWHNWGILLMDAARAQEDIDLYQSQILLRNAQTHIIKALQYSTNTTPMLLQTMASWYEQYAELLQKLIDIPKSISRYYRNAVVYYKKAQALCDQQNDTSMQAIVEDNLSECLAQQGHHLYREKLFRKALTAYYQALQIAPDHTTVISQIGMCFLREYNHQAARDWFKRLLNYPDLETQIDAWLNTSYAYRLEGLWDEAQHALYHAKSLIPQSREHLTHEDREKFLNMNAQILSAETSLEEANKHRFLGMSFDTCFPTYDRFSDALKQNVYTDNPLIYQETELVYVLSGRSTAMGQDADKLPRACDLSDDIERLREGVRIATQINALRANKKPEDLLSSDYVIPIFYNGRGIHNDDLKKALQQGKLDYPKSLFIIDNIFPENTIGQIQSFKRLLIRNGYKHIAVVTSEYHRLRVAHTLSSNSPHMQDEYGNECFQDINISLYGIHKHEKRTGIEYDIKGEHDALTRYTSGEKSLIAKYTSNNLYFTHKDYMLKRSLQAAKYWAKLSIFHSSAHIPGNIQVEDSTHLKSKIMCAL